MRSRLLACISAMLLLSALLLTAAWVHSTSSFDEFTWTSHFNLRLISADSNLSLRLVTFPNITPAPHSINWYQSDRNAQSSYPTPDLLDRPFPSEADSHLSLLGLDFNHSHWLSPIAQSYELKLPYWLAILLTAFPAILQLTLLRHFDRLAAHPPTRCRSCGHTLRTSQPHCPECGTPTPLPNTPG